MLGVLSVGQRVAGYGISYPAPDCLLFSQQVIFASHLRNKPSPKLFALLSDRCAQTPGYIDKRQGLDAPWLRLCTFAMWGAKRGNNKGRNLGWIHCKTQTQNLV